MTTDKAISIIGSGAWGTALGQILAAGGRHVTLWTRRPELAEIINRTHQNPDNLAQIALSPSLKAEANLQRAAQAEILFLVTPAQSLRPTLEQIASFGLKKTPILVLCSKGIELGTGLLMSDIAGQTLPGAPACILSGPNFAREIAQGKPAGTTLASTNHATAEKVQQEISSPHFRAYISNDPTGVQIAGALKNVVAIAAGISQGKDFGESARASLITRGMAEIVRLGCAMGAYRETFLGLSGMGDMMLTCSSTQSRNFALGLALGKGKSLEEIKSENKSVTEGIHTAAAALALAARHNIEMPLAQTIHQCLNENRALDDAIKEMLNRPVGDE